MGEVCYQKIHWEESFLLNTWKKNVSTRSILFVCKAGVGTVYGARQQRTLWSTQTRINLECFVSLSFTSSRESIWWKFIVRVLLLWSRHPAELVKKKSLSWWRHQMETFSALLAICAGIHLSPVNSPQKGQWRGALMFSLICAWTNGWVNNREAGDLRCHRAHYDVNVMITPSGLGTMVIHHSGSCICRCINWPLEVMPRYVIVWFWNTSLGMISG